jgi:hypothetical protein
LLWKNYCPLSCVHIWRLASLYRMYIQEPWSWGSWIRRDESDVATGLNYGVASTLRWS